MNLNDHFINTALLGTANKELPLSDFPEELQNTFLELKGKADDAESAFYQMAALGFAYSRAGVEPQPLDEDFEIKGVSADEATYFSREAGELLLSLAINNNRHLLVYAYRQAVTCGELIHPNYLQPLFTRAFERTNSNRKKEQRFLALLTGNRGRWLLPFMGLPVWGTKEEITWETASHEERKQLLLETRSQNPDAGLGLLQAELKNESAAHREELIRCLSQGLNKNDEAFLQGIVATDRSSNVKDTARQLLCSLPDSQQVQYYRELLKGKLHYNMLLGWSYDKLDFTPEMKKMGLSEVSSVKNEKDDRFLLRQLAERVPLDFWCEFYDCEPEKAARKLAKNPPFQVFFKPWIPIKTFNDSLWAYHTVKEKNDEEFVWNLIGLLSPAQREEITLESGRKDMYIPDDWYNEDGETWGMKFSTFIFKRLLTLTYYYSFTKEQADRTAAYFPREMLPLIEQKMAAASEQDQVVRHICRLLLEHMALKQRIDFIFNDKN